MQILGIETSCDETAAAILTNGTILLSNIVSSQISIHQPYGGVVPELASRHHLRNIVPVIEQALEKAKIELTELDGIAVTNGPGLVGSLLVGIQAAKALAYVADLPLIGINHLEAHLCASRIIDSMERERESHNKSKLAARHLALIVSGGHTALITVESFGHYKILGATRDDAAGEAFDKVAKLLGLGYPGGPIIEKMAQKGNPKAILFPRPLPNRDNLDFSFSGLKTAVANHVKREGIPKGKDIADLCASFQQAVVDVLVNKTFKAVKSERVQTLVAAGGVLANNAIREALIAEAERNGISLYIPPIHLCTDNAAMVAAAGFLRLAAGERSKMDLSAHARLML